jgi:chemotaxis protein CheC
MSTATAVPDPVQIDRLRELASIGAGHAANALAQLVGRTCRMAVPTVAPLARREEDEPATAGVIFQVEGGPGGVVALLFPARARDALLATLAGREPEQVPRPFAESALAEVGNILVSHAVSAMADTLGVTMRPSVPLLAMEGGVRVLAERLSQRVAGVALRLEAEISDPSGEMRSRLVFVPDRA